MGPLEGRIAALPVSPKDAWSGGSPRQLGEQPKTQGRRVGGREQRRNADDRSTSEGRDCRRGLFNLNFCVFRLKITNADGASPGGASGSESGARICNF